jgi:transposase
MFEGMKAYSLDLRQKILRACDQHVGSQRTVAALLGVSQSFIEKLLRRRRTTGESSPRPHAGGRKARYDAAALACVHDLLQAQSDATLEALCARLHAQRGLRVSVPTMSRIVTALGFPRKKSHSTPAGGTPRVSGRHARNIAKGSPRSTADA